MGKQLKFSLQAGHGGRRSGSGRKRKHSPGVAHRPRESVNGRTPLHINFKLKAAIRSKESLRSLKRAIHNARRMGLKIQHFSMLSNHVHLIVEANDNRILTKGMRSLTVTFAKALKLGRIQVERYHLHVLRTLNETRNALRYVLLNEQRHSRTRTVRINAYSTLGTLGIDAVRKFVRREKLGMIWKSGTEKIDVPSSWFLKRAHLDLIT